ncbi:MAG: hypothetical protein IJH91_09465 [Mogibacterium sp.]|nr:hypothetical protein [Mogibacterium sp.]
MITEFYNTGLSGGIDLIIDADAFLNAKYDEREWNNLKYATRAFALAGGADYCIDHSDYVTIRGWLKASKDSLVVFSLKDDPAGGERRCCDVHVVIDGSPTPVIVCEADGRVCTMHRK